MKKNLEKEMETYRLIPVIKITQLDDTLPLVDALSHANLPIAEITFRTAIAAEAIALLKKERPEVLLGAGTVLSVEQVKKAVEAGASFIVAPGFNPTVVDYCIAEGITVIPGVNSPTDVEMGLARGLKVLKFFPAQISGGTEMLKALGSVYEVRFVPTGGINEANLRSYLSLPNVLACGGSWMVKPELIEAKKFDEIFTITSRAMALAHS